MQYYVHTLHYITYCIFDVDSSWAVALILWKDEGGVTSTFKGTIVTTANLHICFLKNDFLFFCPLNQPFWKTLFRFLSNCSYWDCNYIWLYLTQIWRFPEIWRLTPNHCFPHWFPHGNLHHQLAGLRFFGASAEVRWPGAWLRSSFGCGKAKRWSFVVLICFDCLEWRHVTIYDNTIYTLIIGDWNVYWARGWFGLLEFLQISRKFRERVFVGCIQFQQSKDMVTNHLNVFFPVEMPICCDCARKITQFRS